MQFNDLKVAIQRQFDKMKTGALYRMAIDKDVVWDLYLSSFPNGTNPMFRTRREYDCSCCRSFIRQVGDLVTIRDGQVISIWDVQVGEPAFQTVVDALSAYIHGQTIDNIYAHTEMNVGTDKSREMGDDGAVRTWDHFHIQLPTSAVIKGADIGPKLSESRAFHDVFLRGLKEITVDAIETVRDLIGQNILYRGEEKKRIVDVFAGMKASFDRLATDLEKDLFAWSHVQGPNAWVCKIRNDVIGTLLVDLSDGVPLEVAVKSFEDKVSGTNYKRPTALITPKMRDAAKQTLLGLGLLPALDRRFAVIEDIAVTDVLFANRDARKKMRGDVFDDLPVRGQATQKLDKVEEVSVDDFIANVLPTAKGLDVLFENRHTSNLVSLTAPFDPTAPPLFKWSNGFAWSYNGDVADSIKERVKQAGGNVTGDVCCRLAWWNTDDLDFHMTEPSGVEIYFRNRGELSPSRGVLDVDANGIDGLRRDPCENIVYASQRTMAHGVYRLFVHQYAQRQSNDIGFEAEIDILGTVHRFAYPKMLRTGDRVDVAELHVSSDGVKVIPKLDSTQSVKEVWGMKTQGFQSVSTVMLSPNFWGGQGTGNKHYFFMLSDAVNDGSARGFYNEFLRSDLEPHRKAMEMVGARMRTELSDRQLSGLGFSSTQRNDVLCRVTGSFTRIVKITF